MIDRRVHQICDKLVSFRREMHKHPELGMEEKNTNKRIRKFLDDIKIKNKTIAETGVVGLIGTGQTPVIGLRADIDALPIEEEADVPFKSTCPGKMHACGHDIHTTILLGTAQILKEMESELKGTVKLLFEPAEETVGGAIQMIKEGCLENPKVDAVLGLHIMPYLNTGTAEIKYGKMNASSDIITINVSGKSGHGAYPESGIDAIVIASNIVSSLQTIISRNISPVNSAALSFGSIHGGEFENVIASEVILKGTLRTLNTETRTYIKSRIEEISTHQAKAFGGEAKVNFEEGFMPLINDDFTTKAVENSLKKNLGNKNVVIKEFPSLGVESFSYFSSKVPGCFYHLGCKRPDEEIFFPLHSSKFNPDEKCIAVGINLQVQNTLALIDNLNK